MAFAWGLSSNLRLLILCLHAGAGQCAISFGVWHFEKDVAGIRESQAPSFRWATGPPKPQG